MCNFYKIKEKKVACAYGISHDRGGHLFPFLHKNWILKYKTWLGSHTFFYMDVFHGNTNYWVKIYSINND